MTDPAHLQEQRQIAELSGEALPSVLSPVPERRGCVVIDFASAGRSLRLKRAIQCARARRGHDGDAA